MKMLLTFQHIEALEGKPYKIMVENHTSELYDMTAYVDGTWINSVRKAPIIGFPFTVRFRTIFIPIDDILFP